MSKMDQTTESAPLELQAYDAVIGWLSRGELRPGEPLPLREMAKRLGMSRTPLRAAVGRLHEQGIVAYNSRLGFSLALPTIADLFELFDLRIMCETHALRRFFTVKERLVPHEVRRMAQETWDLAGKIVDDAATYPQFSMRDRQMHREIVALGGSSRLADWYGQLNLFTIIFRLGWTVPRNEEEFRTSAGEHLAGVDAIERGDRDGAIDHLEAHLIRVRDLTIARLTGAGTAPLAPSRGDWLDRLSNSSAGL